jgi:hypothetical protein
MTALTGVQRVDISSFDRFRAATIGKAYATGSSGVQCVGGADLLWRNVSLILHSNWDTGRIRSGSSARLSWEDVINRERNRQNGQFLLVSNPRDIKRGDVVVFGQGVAPPWGHIGFADMDYPGDNATICLYDQGGGASVTQVAGREFKTRRYNTRHIIGGFRYVEWVVRPEQPTINDAMEILKKLAGLENLAPREATINDVMDILTRLAGIRG